VGGGFSAKSPACASPCSRSRTAAASCTCSIYEFILQARPPARRPRRHVGRGGSRTCTLHVNKPVREAPSKPGGFLDGTRAPWPRRRRRPDRSVLVVIQRDSAASLNSALGELICRWTRQTMGPPCTDDVEQTAPQSYSQPAPRHHGVEHEDAAISCLITSKTETSSL
jgi:hypothetical protein